MTASTHPIVVVGAGPVGLAAAAHLLERGLEPLVLERGAAPGAAISEWAHVPLFSPWRFVVDDASRRLLEAAGWSAPDGESFPTGGDLVARYVSPLAATPALAPRIRTHARVVSITRQGRDRASSAGRAEAPFLVRVETAHGVEDLAASAVVDASGTWGRPAPAGAHGLPARGESALADRIHYGIPDVFGAERARYANRRVLVVGSGHSAIHAVLDLARLAAESATQVTWAIRRADLSRLIGGGERDQLEERGRLGLSARSLVERGGVELAPSFHLEAFRVEGEVFYARDGARELGPFDRAIVATGFRPDLGMLGELRLAVDPIVEAPVALAPLIDPNLHSCGTVPPHGYLELAHPEPGLFVVGMKSYGRAPTFLLLTGYEQVRSIAAHLAGDEAAAREVRLALPETGACGTGAFGGGGALDETLSGAAACCGAAPRPLGIVASPEPCCGTPHSAAEAAATGVCCSEPAPSCGCRN